MPGRAVLKHPHWERRVSHAAHPPVLFPSSPTGGCSLYLEGKKGQGGGSVGKGIVLTPSAQGSVSEDSGARKDHL